jgi:superkiller protein 3
MESKLLHHKYNLLGALPTPDSDAVERSKVVLEIDNLAKGIVLLKVAEELAWTIVIENMDSATIGSCFNPAK